MATTAAVLVFAGLGGTWRAAASQGRSQAELRKPFVGTWRLVSIEGGNDPTSRGAKPTGIIMYDAHGNMAAQQKASKSVGRTFCRGSATTGDC